MAKLFGHDPKFWTQIALAPLSIGAGLPFVGNNLAYAAAEFFLLLGGAILIWVACQHTGLGSKGRIERRRWIIRAILFTAFAAMWPPLSARLSTNPAAALADPVVELALGQPFGSKTMIALRNAGSVSVVDVAVNLRCFLLATPDDLQPALLFEGFPSLENKNAWWVMATLDVGVTQTKDAHASLTRFLQNKRALEESQAQRKFAKMVLAVDVVYQRNPDRKNYSVSAIAELAKDSNRGEPFVWPLPMSDFYRRLLESVTAPNYRHRS